MSKLETIEDFYKERIGWMPPGLRQDIGHFNVLKSDPYLGKSTKPAPYRRREYYKIKLSYGRSEMNFADNVAKIEKQALWFSSPHIPYSTGDLSEVRGGFFCVFNQQFFYPGQSAGAAAPLFGNLDAYPIYQPGGAHAFELTDEQAQRVESIFLRMVEEINSDYVYKYDILRSLVFDLIHFALKMQPASAILVKHSHSASERIASLFIELVERQYPIDEANQKVVLRTASDFASHLNIHVNHLNRALKEITGKTTTQIIAERNLKEAKLLLRRSAWTVSEIAYALGSLEVAHFNAFFKKHIGMTPLTYRNI